MNGKVFVGQKALSLTEYEKTAPISGVILWVDDNNCYQAGNDTGTVIENDCPYGTQEMANALLQKLSGYEYQGIEANGAVVTLIAELGDGLTINGIYTQLAYQNIRFSTGEVMDVAAPGKNETLHEYQTEGETSKWFSHQIAQTRSEISKTSEEIMLSVKNEIQGLSSSIDIQLDTITSTVQGQGGQISTLQQTATSLQSQITSINGDVSSLEQTATSLQSQITSANGDISTLQQYSNQLSSIITNVSGDVSTLEQKVDSITLSVSNAYSSSTIELLVNGISVASERIRFTGTVVFEDDLADGTTTVSGDCITTGEVSARYIRLGGQMDVYESLSSSADVGGYIGYMTGMTAAGSSTSGIAICSYDESALVICTSAGVRMGYDGVSTVVCTSTQVSIRGDAGYINGEPQSASDARLKTQVQEDLDRYLPVFDKLRPVTFVYDGHKRRHMGFIAQEIQQTLADEGIPESDFAALCTEVPNDERPMGMYSLRYGELQIMTVAKVQELDRRMKLLEAQYGQG